MPTLLLRRQIAKMDGDTMIEPKSAFGNDYTTHPCVGVGTNGTASAASIARARLTLDHTLWFCRSLLLRHHAVRPPLNPQLLLSLITAHTFEVPQLDGWV